MAIFTKRIDADIRDLWDWNGGSWNVSDDLERIGNLGGTISGVSLRFIGVTVPQGAIITSAKVTFRATNTKSNTDIDLLIRGVDEDNTAEFVKSPIDTARTRTNTTANVSWSGAISWTSGNDYDTSNIASIIQEIVDRGNWSSGNALAISIQDNGSGNSEYLNPRDYTWDSANAPLLTIVYEASSESASISASPSSSESGSPSASPSVSVSPSSSESASISASPSASLSPSASISASPSSTPSVSISSTPSASASASVSSTPSASPSPPSPFFGLRIAKPDFNALTEDDPNNLVFSSEYETLKYHLSGTVTIEAVVDGLDQKFYGYYEHNLGYIPYFEAYVQEIDGSTYLPVPFMKTGASTAIWYSVYADTTKIYFEIRMMSYAFDTYTFPFKYFIFKNSLGL